MSKGKTSTDQHCRELFQKEIDRCENGMRELENLIKGENNLSFDAKEARHIKKAHHVFRKQLKAAHRKWEYRFFDQSWK